MAEDKVRVALALLQQAGHMDLVRPEVLAAERPVRRASAGIAAAVLACSPPRADFDEEEPDGQCAARSPWQERKAGPGAAGRMTASGRRGGWREAADAPTGWCGGLGFAPADAAARGSSVRARHVYEENFVCRM
ncbi:hypothetical protein NDU88_002764 [Pleurodeles waltl]|uniref:Uncharacterized protein n=1 Tax=Pleurodeles waltl TaxID=8319 RepID=A0AAV7KVM5_PLEWA|nr:hypothetical protein NDU88_002764 [Pleurodeles waltl]